MKAYIILALLVILIQSCHVLDATKSYENYQEITEDNMIKTNGNYCIVSKDSSYHTLESLLFNRTKYNVYTGLLDSTVKLNLEFISSTELKATLLKGDKVIQTNIKKGYFDGGYFNFKRRIYFKFRFLLNALGGETTRIGLLKNNNLIADTYNGGMVFLIVIPVGGAETEIYGLEFQRKE